MNLTDLKKQSLAGWNTWYSESVLTHVLLPWGFAINLNFRKISSGDILHALLVRREPEVRADVRSFGGAYTCLHVRHGNVPLKVESAVRGGEQFIMVTPDGYYTSDEQLIVETMFLWGRDGTLIKENGKLSALCPDGTRVHLHSNTAPYEYYLPEWHTPSLFFTLDAPVVISTVPCTTEEAYRIMGEQKRALALEAERYGEYAESFSAMQSVLAWNTIYDPIKNRVCAPVSRNWNRGKGGMIFCWDTFFAAMMFAEGGEESSAYLTFFSILDEMFGDGMLPNISISTGGNNGDHSQPPVGSMAAEKIYAKFKNIGFLRESFPKLLRWNTWFYENRMRADGTMSWGSRTRGKWQGTLFGAKCESGMDNSPAFDDAVYDEESGLLMQASVGLTGLFVKDCKALINIAKILGKEGDVAVLAARKARAETGLCRLWHAEAEFFDNLDLATGRWVQRRTPMNFFALFSDEVSTEQKRSLAENYLLNPEEFWGEYVLPSVSRRDFAFAEQHYWRGRIWAPLNLLVYEALKDAGLLREAKLLAEKSASLMMHEWRKEHHVYENYSAVDGLGSSARQADSFYHWGALLGYIALDAKE
ncbi:MAG: hypothetical protein IJ021_00130 [Clostridia bacterium]|nr:hypothetical protein [Clostridia bacterium]